MGRKETRLRLDPAALTAKNLIEANDNEAPHGYILVHTGSERRSITNGCWSNGLDTWRTAKSRYDPERDVYQIGATLRALRLMKVGDIKDLLPALARVGRRDQEARESLEQRSSTKTKRRPP